MSKLRVNEISHKTGTGNIAIPTGNSIVGADVGSVYAPGTTIQVVSTTFSSTWSSASNGTSFYEVTGLRTIITPKLSTSKILISTSIAIGSGYWEIQGRYTRNGTPIGLGDQRGSRSRCTFLDNRYEATGGQRNGWGTVSAQYLDSPSTTSEITYSVELNGYSTYTIAVNYNPYSDYDSSDYFGTPISTMTVMEIAQ